MYNESRRSRIINAYVSSKIRRPPSYGYTTGQTKRKRLCSFGGPTNVRHRFETISVRRTFLTYTNCITERTRAALKPFNKFNFRFATRETLYVNGTPRRPPALVPCIRYKLRRRDTLSVPSMQRTRARTYK